MATNTYVALDKITLTSTASSVTFSSISSAYTDLVIVVNAKASTVTNTYMRVGNGSVDTGSNYSRTGVSGNGSAASSYRGSSQTLFYCDNNSAPDASNFNYVDTIHLMNYSNTTTYKTFLNRANNAGYGTEAQVGLWRSTSAINTILLGTASGTWAVGTTFSLYGISTVGDASPKATGGDVYSDTNYWYHAFPMSGNFVPNQSLTADVLVVAGGGGSGRATGGGGAGGISYLTSQSLTTSTSYSVTIGGGGLGQNDVNGLKGSDSTFSTLATAYAGGAGSRTGGSIANGGSGGGVAIGNTPGTANSGTGGTGYANAGAAGHPTNGGYGGGGGSGAAGGQNTGGNGTSAFSSWLSATGFGQNISGTYYIAGGGGGQQNSPVPNPAVSGGYGGGGASGDRTSGTATAGTAGLVSSGSGAGGGGIGASDGIGANGGSGIVIVRYAK